MVFFALKLKLVQHTLSQKWSAMLRILIYWASSWKKIYLVLVSESVIYKLLSFELLNW